MTAELFVYGNVTDLDLGCPAVHVIYMAPGSGDSVFVRATIGESLFVSDLLTAGSGGTVGENGFDWMELFLNVGDVSAPATVTIHAGGELPDLTVTWHDPADPDDSVGCPNVGSSPPLLTGTHLDGVNTLHWSPVTSGDAHFPDVVYTLNRAPLSFPPGGAETTVYESGPGISFADTPPADTIAPFDDVWYYRVTGYEPYFGYGVWSNIVALGGSDTPPPTTVKAWGVLAR